MGADDDDGAQADRVPERHLPRIVHPDPDVAVAEILADIRDEARRRDAGDRVGHSRWTTGTILGAIVSVIAIVGSAATTLQGYTQLGDRLQSFGERMLTMDARVSLVESTIRDRGASRDHELASLTATDALQDERLRNMTVALEQERQARTESEADARRAAADLRAVVNDLAKTIGELRTDLKVLVDRAERKSSLEGPASSPDTEYAARHPR